MRNTVKSAAGGLRFLLLAVLAPVLLPSCSTIRAAASLDDVFFREEDPLLAAEAFPILIKGSEALLAGSPRDPGLTVQTASLYVMYASAFVEGRAWALPPDRIEEKQAAVRRAAALYTRALILLEPLLELRAPGVGVALLGKDGPPGGPAEPLARLSRRDVPLLYWTAAAILARYALDPTAMESAKAVGAAPALLEKAVGLDPSWNSGALREIRISLFASLPDYMGGGLDRAEAEYLAAVEAAGGETPSLALSWAGNIAVSRDDAAGFVAALRRALSPGARVLPEGRLSAALARDKARVMLENVGDYVFIPEGATLP